MKKPFLITLLLLCLSTLLFAQDSFKDRYTEANILLEDNYYALSLPIWLDLYKESPDNANINYKIGVCYLNLQNDRKKALSYLEKAAENISRNYDQYIHTEKRAPLETHYYLGRALLLNNEIEDARTSFETFKSSVGKKHYLREDADLHLTYCNNAKELMANPVNVKITSLGKTINSSYREFGPVISMDENVIYFTTRRLRSDDSNKSGIDPKDGLYYEDIYVSYRQLDDEWSDPEPINISRTNDHDATIGLSSDGQTLYTYRNASGNGNIYESILQENGIWSTPALVGSDVNTGANETHVAISADGTRLYFTSDRKGGYGGKDIYRCYKLPTGEWSKSQNLGPQINTPYDEEGPFIHPDDKTLFFSSKGHKSMGGYDIFFSKLQEDSTWTLPENVGYPINTTDDDVFYMTMPDGKRAYYSSSKEGGFGDTDIYIVDKVDDSPQESTFDLSRFALLKGYILTPKSQPIPAGTKIIVTDINSGKVIGDSHPRAKNGSFVFILPTGNKYHMVYKIDEETFFEEDVDIPLGISYKEIHREVLLRPIKIGDDVKTEIIVLRDDLLSSKLKWQIKYQDAKDSQVPVGIKVNYLADDGTVIHTEYVSKDGYFKYHKLPEDESYTLQLEYEEDIASDLLITLVNELQHPDQGTSQEQIIGTNKQEPKTGKDDELIKGEIPEKLVLLSADNKIFSLKENKPGLAETPTPLVDTDQESETAEVEDENIKLPGSGSTSSKNLYYFVKFDYNKNRIKPTDKEFVELVDGIVETARLNGIVEITIEASASKVPTTTYKTNEHLAEVRGNRAKELLVSELKKRGLTKEQIDFVRISTLVQGPEYSKTNPRPKSIYMDFQYVRIIGR